MTAEFDAIADEYLRQHTEATGGSGDDPAYFAWYKINDIVLDRKRRKLPRDGCVTCLDFGAGIGTSEPHLRSAFPNARIIAADVSGRSLEINRGLHGDAAEYLHIGNGLIDLPDNSVDFALAACVFHHIDHADHPKTLKEILRVLRPGGDLYVFEHNPINPITVKVVKACAFDENAVLISGSKMSSVVGKAGFAAAKPVFRYFFPAWLKVFRPLEGLFRSLPVGGQYYVRGTKPRS